MRPEEIPSYPHLGHIYPGDYCASIPYEDYLVPQTIPQGKDVFDLSGLKKNAIIAMNADIKADLAKAGDFSILGESDA